LSKSSWASPQRLGKYQLRERLGYGGVAEVYKAFDTELQRYVAIKLLHADLQTDPEFITRFSREARFVAALHHPNIVQIHDFQTTYSPEINAPIAYMVMDYVEGETLAQFIRRTAQASNFPAPTDIVHLFVSISKAVDYAHQEGMIHRDIKPANILLDKRHTAPHSMGEPVLTDFGIARIIGASSGTMTGIWLGTPRYVSPEQAQGYPGTKRSDIYSLGIILYEICTGVCPFRGESTTALIAQHINSPPPPPALINPAIPPALTATILQALAKDPAERFSSTSALTAAIAEAFNLPVPSGLFLPVHPSNDLPEPTYLSPHQPDLSPHRTPQRLQSSRSLPVMASQTQTPSPAPTASTPQTPPPTPITPTPQAPRPTPTAPQLTSSPTSGEVSPVIPTSSIPASLSLPSPVQSAQATAPSSVPAVKLPQTGPFLRPVQSWKGRKRQIIAWLAILLILASSILVLLNVLSSQYASPVPTTSQTVGTLILTDSGQYDPDTTVGYNDIVSLSLHSLTAPGTGMAYFAWLLPDQGDDATPPLLLGRLSVNAGKATLQYVSPTHTNLLAQYSEVRIIEQQAPNDPSTPSPDPKTWRWEGWIPHTPTPGDPKHFSMLSHFRHLLAKDPTLQANQMSGGLVIWMTRNMGKVEEWSSAAQGSWGDGNADLIHRHLIRILDYLDGQTYVGQDVPAGSPWLVDLPAGKLGLLSYTQGQQPPGYLPHVDHHLQGLADSPGHTEEQKKVAIQMDNDLTRMINDLTQVRKDTVQLVQRSNEQLLQPDALTLLNEMATLTRETNSGWFDTTTHENRGGAIWMNARIQQLATISVHTSNPQ
jgi:eukaryotic-like serine/threonine-protein kinase